MANNNKTFAQLQESVRLEMQLDPGLISVDERKNFINNCIDELGRIGLFVKTATIPVLLGVADVPDDFSGIIGVHYNGVPLKPSAQMPNVTGDTPLKYFFLYNKIKVIPSVASCNIELTYSYKPARLVAEGDKPDLPLGWDNLIVDFAVGSAHRKNGNIGLYREYMGAYNSGRGELVTELMKRLNSSVVDTIDSEGGQRISYTEDILI